MAKQVDLGIQGIGPATMLARGGSAYVYLAEQEDFGRQVAVKVLFDALEDEATIKRFDRECRAIGAVSSHPNIVVVHGRGLTADDRPYLVMEYRSGGSLAEKLAARGRLTEAETIRIGTKIGAALGVAHEAGVIHRDVKPANILLSAYNEPALADFGIARIDGGHKTTQGLFSASVAHASREILDSGEPTVRSDIYSLASTMFELVTGRAPFHDPEDVSMWAVINRVLSQDAPDSTLLGASDELAAVLTRALSHNPEARHASTDEFIADLERPSQPTPLATVTTKTTPVVSETAKVQAITSPSDSKPVVTQPDPGAAVEPRSRTGLLVTVSVAIVALVALVSFALISSGRFSVSVQDASRDSEEQPDSTVDTEQATSSGTEGSEEREPTIGFSRSQIGPLRSGDRYLVDVLNSPEVASYRLLINGDPQGDPQDAVPVFFPTEGRHQLQVEVTTDDRVLLTDPVEIYVSGSGPTPGYRANLASIRSRPENWPGALELYDNLIEQGHVDLKVDQSTRVEQDGLPFWNFYIDGFGEDIAQAQEYCDGFGLDADGCFVAPTASES